MSRPVDWCDGARSLRGAKLQMPDRIDFLTTARLILRRPGRTDTAAYFAIYGDPATNRFNPAGPVPDLSHAEADMTGKLAGWDANGFGTWAVCLQAQPDRVIGFGGLAHKLYGQTERVNLGYRFAPSAWGCGYATELAAQALETARQLRLDQVWGTVRENHLASRRVLEKVGMVRHSRVPDPRGVPASLWYVTRTSPE